MIGIYLLISIFAQVSAQNILFTQSSGPAEVHVTFDKLSGINVGSPVIAEGQLIGTVTRVKADAVVPDSADTQRDSSSYRVMLKISPGHRGLLREGTVALIASPLSAARVRPETVLELLIPREKTPPVLKDGDRIIGYSSYEEFWSADLTMNEKQKSDRALS